MIYDVQTSGDPSDERSEPINNKRGSATGSSPARTVYECDTTIKRTTGAAPTWLGSPDCVSLETSMYLLEHPLEVLLLMSHVRYSCISRFFLISKKIAMIASIYLFIFV